MPNGYKLAACVIREILNGSCWCLRSIVCKRIARMMTVSLKMRPSFNSECFLHHVGLDVGLRAERIVFGSDSAIELTVHRDTFGNDVSLYDRAISNRYVSTTNITFDLAFDDYFAGRCKVAIYKNVSSNNRRSLRWMRLAVLT